LGAAGGGLARLAPELAGAVVIDGHLDTPTRLLHHPADLTRALPDGHVDLPRLRAGGVTSPFFAYFVPHFLEPADAWRHALALDGLLRDQLRPGELEIVVSAQEVRRAAAAGGAVGVLLGLENGRCLTVPDALARCADLGVRYVTLTHIASHEWCDASTDDPRHHGLSDDGVRIVRAMRRLGILVDLSHVSDDAALHAMDAVRAPVIASHSSARALCDHPRNLPDGLIRDVARGGGVVMANAYPAFLDAAAAEASRRRSEIILSGLAEAAAEGELSAEEYHRLGRDIAAAHPLPPVPLERLVDHVLHLVEVAGEDHVGIGTDFDGITEVPEGFEDVSRFPALVERLLARGLPPRAVRLLLGENLLRVLEDAERRVG
jgi:membrane dipeptidase